MQKMFQNSIYPFIHSLHVTFRKECECPIQIPTTYSKFLSILMGIINYGEKIDIKYCSLSLPSSDKAFTTELKRKSFTYMGRVVG